MNKTSANSPSNSIANQVSNINYNLESGIDATNQELLSLINDDNASSPYSEPTLNKALKNKKLKTSSVKTSIKSTNKKKSFSQVLDSAKQRLEAKQNEPANKKSSPKASKEVNNFESSQTQPELEESEHLFKEIAFQAQYIQQIQQQINLDNQNSSYIQDRPANSRLQQIIDELQNANTANLPGDPTIELDAKNLKMNINFPEHEELKSVQVQYDPTTRGISAEIITSQVAVEVLQEQVNQLERNLAKHNIKLQSLKINPRKVQSSSSGSFSHQKHRQQNSQQS